MTSTNLTRDAAAPSHPPSKQSRRQRRTQEKTGHSGLRGGENGARQRNLPGYPPRGGKKPKSKRLLLLVIAGALGLGAISLLVIGMVQWWQQSSGSGLEEGEHLLIELENPPLEIPPRNAPLGNVTGEMNETVAKQVIDKWLSSKSAAFGTEHQIDQLNQILAQPLLSQWRNRAMQLKASNAYRQYQHTVRINSVKTSPNQPELVTIEAEVSENAKYYQDSELNQNRSYTETLQVRYQLVRQDEQWLVKKIEVIK